MDGRHRKYIWTQGKSVSARQEKVALISEKHRQEVETDQCLIQREGSGKAFLQECCLVHPQGSPEIFIINSPRILHFFFLILRPYFLK